MNGFIYEIPTKVYFGENHLSHLGEELKKLGRRVLLVYGGGSIKKTGLYGTITAEVRKAGLELLELPGIEPNPRVSSVNKGAALCRKEGVDVILAVGGGSTIDAAKAIGAAVFYEGDAWDLVVRKAPVTQSLPLITVLTLAATGSEMDHICVISNMDTNDKFGMSHPSMQPKVSFLDPTNTYSVSPYQTACGCADMMSHILESYFTPQPDLAMLDRSMEGWLKTVMHYAPIAMKNGKDYEARANLMWISSWAINGFLTGGKRQAWSCHAIEHQLSAYYDIAHGMGLAIVTPHWMEHVLSAETVGIFQRFARNVFDVPATLPAMEAAKEGISRLADFFYGTLGLQRTLTEIGINDEHFAEMASKISGKEPFPGFAPLAESDVMTILRRCL